MAILAILIRQCYGSALPLLFSRPTFNVPQLFFAGDLTSDVSILKLSDAQFKLNLAVNENGLF
jgi:hypothetical protein